MKKYWPFLNFYKKNLNIQEKEIQQLKYFMHSFKDTCDNSHITTYRNINILELPILKNLKKELTNTLNSLNLSLTDNWAQLYLKSQKHDPHIHENSVYSGVIYIDGKGSDGTNFIDNYSGQIFKEKFIKKTLILFPSNLIHFVENQEKNNERLIVSFNTVYKKN